MRCLALGLGALVAISLGGAPAHAAPKDHTRAKGAQKAKGTHKSKKGKEAPPATAKAAPRAPAAPVVADAPLELRFDLHRETLANGLRVVIDVDHTSPTVAINVVYDVGSRNEERGRSGFAHLFEHMMFQGSKNVAKGDHYRLVSGHGGIMNGTTNADRTLYYEVLPENELALGLWLEADRMRSLDVSQANFENQRKVVEEEYRMRVSNAAYAPSGVRLQELVFQGYWPYEHDTIGSMADLDVAKIDWVQAFHTSHYGPNNAILVVAGDVTRDAVMGLVHKYFDSIPKVAIAPYQDPSLPEQTSPRTSVVKDEHARTPDVLMGWAVPPGGSPDHYALDVLGSVLADGESSRLYQLLVRDRALAQHVSAETWQRRGPDIFRVHAALRGGAKPAEVERLVEGEIKALATRGPTDAELVKAHRQIASAFVLYLAPNLARARKLGEAELYFGDARRLEGEIGRYVAVTRDDVKRAAAKYLDTSRRTVVETYPADADVEPKAERPARVSKAEGPAHAAPAASGKKHTDKSKKHNKKP